MSLELRHFSINTEERPYYQQIFQYIYDKIVCGDLLPGEQLPPEQVLSKDFGVSRHTIRKAMDLLVSEGLLYRQAGKGTFVNKIQASYPLSYLYSFSEQMKNEGKTPSSVVLEVETNLVPKDSLKQRLSLTDNERITRIYRLRLADNQPMSLEEVFINSNLVPGIEDTDLEKRSLYEILEKDYNLVIEEGDINLGAKSASAHQAGLLQLEEGEPLVYMDCLTYLENNRPAFLTFAHYPHDRYVFSLSLLRDNG